MHRAMLVVVVLALWACDGGSGGVPAEDSGPEVTADTAPDVPVGPTPWESDFEPDVELRDGVWILRLKGTPYDMGVQFATLMRDQLIDAVEIMETTKELSLMEPIAQAMGFIEEATEMSYPWAVEECQGMADVLGDEGWTFERCIMLAWGDVIIEHLQWEMNFCTQFVAAGGATTDGELLHGRNLDWSDWDAINFLLGNPTIIVRHPEGRIPTASIGFPGNVTPYTAISAAGLSMASNDADALEESIDRTGRSHVQMVREVLETATSLEDVEAFILSEDHMVSELLTVADGNLGEAAVFELTGAAQAVRHLDDAGVVWAVNHFVEAATAPHGLPVPAGQSTLLRNDRLTVLLGTGEGSLVGQLDPEAAVAVLRDRINPTDGSECPVDAWKTCVSIGTNGAVHGVVFVPGRRHFFVALGPTPVLSNPFLGYSMYELLGLEDPAPLASPAIP
ncbi:MAG: C45 family peptidase [Pseudomonadota bacterium]